MSKFRKKPVVVEAFQITKEGYYGDQPWPKWLKEAWSSVPGEGAVWIEPASPPPADEPCQLICGTLEGVCRISWDDWLIQGVKGEIYPCKPDIFEQTYEPVGECGDAT